jgi:hypothetical protein
MSQLGFPDENILRAAHTSPTTSNSLGVNDSQVVFSAQNMRGISQFAGGFQASRLEMPTWFSHWTILRTTEIG